MLVMSLPLRGNASTNMRCAHYHFVVAESPHKGVIAMERQDNWKWKNDSSWFFEFVATNATSMPHLNSLFVSELYEVWHCCNRCKKLLMNAWCLFYFLARAIAPFSHILKTFLSRNTLSYVLYVENIVSFFGNTHVDKLIDRLGIFNQSLWRGWFFVVGRKNARSWCQSLERMKWKK